SEDVQNVTGQTQFVLPNGSRLLFDAGVSNSRQVGSGYAAGVTFEQEFDRGGLSDSFIIQANYLSQHFAGLGSPDADNNTSL
ncbi:hypothetical protein ACSTLM_00035, partial [Vibrio parahaemolyticus]